MLYYGIGPTSGAAVVGDVGCHVDGLVVDAQVPHAAHEVRPLDWEVLVQVGNPPQQQGSREIQ